MNGTQGNGGTEQIFGFRIFFLSGMACGRNGLECLAPERGFGWFFVGVDSLGECLLDGCLAPGECTGVPSVLECLAPEWFWWSAWHLSGSGSLRGGGAFGALRLGRGLRT